MHKRLVFLFLIVSASICSFVLVDSVAVSAENDVRVADLLQDLKNKVDKLTKPTTTPPPAPNAPVPKNETGAAKKTDQPVTPDPPAQSKNPRAPASGEGNSASTNPSEVLTLDGYWLGRNWDLYIEGNSGFRVRQIASPGQVREKPTILVLKIKERTSPTTFRGLFMDTNSSDDWRSVLGEVKKDGGLYIGGVVFARPTLPERPEVDAGPSSYPPETAASGTIYSLDRYFKWTKSPKKHCLVVGLLPKSIDISDWPKLEGLSPITEAYKFWQEAAAYGKKACDGAEPTALSVNLTHEKSIDHTMEWDDATGFRIVNLDRMEAVIYPDSVHNVGAQRQSQARVGQVEQQSRNQQVAANDRRAAVLRQYNARFVSEVSELNALYTNPFTMEGQVIALNVKFSNMNGANSAEFVQHPGFDFTGSGYIVASGVPKTAFSQPIDAVLIGKVIGQIDRPGIAGVRGLHLKYVASRPCPNGVEQCY